MANPPPYSTPVRLRAPLVQGHTPRHDAPSPPGLIRHTPRRAAPSNQFTAYQSQADFEQNGPLPSYPMQGHGAIPGPLPAYPMQGRAALPGHFQAMPPDSEEAQLLSTSCVLDDSTLAGYVTGPEAVATSCVASSGSSSVSSGDQRQVCHNVQHLLSNLAPFPASPRLLSCPAFTHPCGRTLHRSPAWRWRSHPGGSPGANRWFLQSTPIQMPPESGGICGRLT